MSDPRDNEESDQDLPELSEDDILEEDDEETEDDEFPPLIDTPTAAQASHLPGFLDAPLGDASSEPITPITPADEMIPLPLQGIAEATSGENAEIGPRSVDAPDAHGEEEGKLRVMKLENGGASLEVKAEAEGEAEAEGGDVRLGDNVLTAGAVKKEEGFNQSRPSSPNFLEGGDTGSEEEQSAFMKELERFHKERSLEFKPPKFYGEGLNCLKLWRAVARLGGYERVTSCKLWRQVGESFRPPKTCTTVSWTFRIFYEKALLEYEKHKVRTGELQVPMPSLSESMSDKKEQQTPARHSVSRTNAQFNSSLRARSSGSKHSRQDEDGSIICRLVGAFDRLSESIDSGASAIAFSREHWIEKVGKTVMGMSGYELRDLGLVLRHLASDESQARIFIISPEPLRRTMIDDILRR